MGNTVNQQRVTRSVPRTLPASSRIHRIFENVMHVRLERSAGLKVKLKENRKQNW